MVKIPNPEIPLCTNDLTSRSEILFLMALDKAKILCLSGIAMLLLFCSNKRQNVKYMKIPSDIMFLKPSMFILSKKIIFLNYTNISTIILYLFATH